MMPFNPNARALGESVNGFINRAIRETLERDAAKDNTDAQNIPSQD